MRVGGGEGALGAGGMGLKEGSSTPNDEGPPLSAGWSPPGIGQEAITRGFIQCNISPFSSYSLTFQPKMVAHTW